MKRILGLLTLISLFFSFLPNAFASETNQPAIRVNYQGKALAFEVPPVLEVGSVLVPFRGVFEEFGLTVGWESSNKRVTGTNDAVKIDMSIGKKTVLVNNEQKLLEVEPKIIDGNTMVPLRFVSESMGKVVTWDPATNSVDIVDKFSVKPTVPNYGGESYYPTNFSNQLGRTNPYMYERDGYLFLFWSEELKSGPFVDFYCSIADLNNRKWVYQNNHFKYVKKETSAFQYFFYENSLYWRTQDGVLKSSIDGTGSVTQDVYVARKFNQREKEIMSAVRYDDGKVGVILGAKNSVSLYTEEATNGLLDIKDLNNILFENSNSNTQYIINRSSKKIHIISNNTAKQLDYETGQINFDEKGKDKIEKLKGTSFTQPFYYRDKLYYLYQEGQDRRAKIGMIDDSLRNEEMAVINFVAPYNLSDYKVTINEKEFHLWRNTEFSRLPAIDFTNIAR
jgi:hypothetical protein